MKKQWTDIEVELALTRIKITNLMREYTRLKKAHNPKMWVISREIQQANKLAHAIVETIEEAKKADALRTNPN